MADNQMITEHEAREIIREHITALLPVMLPLQQAAGKVLAEDVFAVLDIPAFPQSSMDGYAFSIEAWKANGKLTIEGEMAAGTDEKLALTPGQAVRIFTGAPLPTGADTVVMQEKTVVQSGQLIIEDRLIQQGANVRPMGSEIKAGGLALAKNSMLTPAAIGFMAGVGYPELKVYPDPLISIIVTGKELQQPGRKLHYGQVYESNSFTLSSAIRHLRMDEARIFYAVDDLALLTAELERALDASDMVLLTGGISAGDYDFVLQAATQCGVSKQFHKIRQRPGKPLYFGTKENKVVFGLPGNPSSVLTCFYEYVLPALEILTHRELSLQTVYAPLSASFRKTALLTHFLKGYYNGKTVTILDAQESYRLSSFAKANCLVRIGEETTECKEGDIVELHLLPA